MIKRTDADELIQRQCARYPRLEVQDVVKALYQAEFGCEHLVQGDNAGLDRLLKECAQCGTERANAVEPLGDAYCRVHLAGLRNVGLSVRTLYRLFTLSSQTAERKTDRFGGALERLQTLADEGVIPFGPLATRQYLSAYRAAGCPAVHHSVSFREAYAPAYRVVCACYGRLIELIGRVDSIMAAKARVCVAIEGASASGKTSLAALLAQIFDANVFHMDDFFLQPDQRTPERYREAGGNVDRERFLQEVLRPMQANEPFEYRVFDCARMAMGRTVHVTPKKLNIVEGAYSMHPALESAYDLSVFIDVDAHEQSARVLLRNGPEMHRRFIDTWIPLENAYFAATSARTRCDMSLRMNERI